MFYFYSRAHSMAIFNLFSKWCLLCYYDNRCCGKWCLLCYYDNRCCGKHRKTTKKIVFETVLFWSKQMVIVVWVFIASWLFRSVVSGEVLKACHYSVDLSWRYNYLFLLVFLLLMLHGTLLGFEYVPRSITFDTDFNVTGYSLTTLWWCLWFNATR